MTGRGMPLIARIVQITVILGCVAGLLWVGMKFFEPVSAPAPERAKPAVKFNPSVDVSKNSVFGGLQPYGPATVESGETGKINPFIPLPPLPKPTSTATSTILDSRF